MNERNPQISILLPTYNQPTLIRGAIEAVLNQTYKNFEFIISNNCSPNPEIDKICREYAEKDSRIKYYLQKENIGCEKNTAFCLSKMSNNLFFKEGILSEDIDWSARLLIYADKIDVIDRAAYIYRYRQNSISKSLGRKNIEDLIANIENSISYIPKSDELKYEYMSYIAFQYLTLMIVPNYVNEDLPKEVVSKIKELKYLLRYDLNNKVHKFRLI